MRRALVWCVLFLSVVHYSGCSVCKATGGVNASDTAYHCPGPQDPPQHTQCCGQASGLCCPQARYFYEIDTRVATVIAVCVSCVCLLVAILFAVCCFWSACPLYSSCRTHYSSDVATYVSKEDGLDLDAMPRELSSKGNNEFTPVTVSNGNLPLAASASADSIASTQLLS